MAPRRYEALIAGETRGVLASGTRGVLRGLAAAYTLGIDTRNRLFDLGLRSVCTLDIPVLSVGNLTVGGTGKTPMVLWLCAHLTAAGRRVAVLARGYGAKRGHRNDELELVARQFPDVVCIANPDRAAAAREVMRHHAPDFIVLDDGFQHRQFARDLDIVLLDATCPFGYGYVLPRGLLREPARALRRAGLVVVTHCDRVSAEVRGAIVRRVRAIAESVDVISCRHRPEGCVDLRGRPADPPPNHSRVACVSSIARPESFVHTIRAMGHDPVATRTWPDHHAYTPQDIAEIQAWAERLSVDAVLTTEKDAVKLAARAPTAAPWPCPMLAVRVAIDFESHDHTRLVDHVDRCLRDVTASGRGIGHESEGGFRHP